MSQAQTRKRLFADNYRRRPRKDGSGSRLLGGQALARAQRLSHPAMRPGVLSMSLFMLELLSFALIGLFSAILMAAPFPSFMVLSCVVWIGALVAVAVTRLVHGYGFRTMRRVVPSLGLGLVGMGVGGVLAFGAMSLAQLDFAPRRDWFLVWGAVSGVALIALRIWTRLRILYLTRTGEIEHRIVIVGGGHGIEPLIHEIDKEHRKGRRMCGFFDERQDQRSPDVIAGHHKMGDVDDLVEFARLAQIDTVIVAIPNASHRRLMDLLARLFVLPVDIRVLEGAETPEFSRKRRSKIGSFTLIELYKKPLDVRKAFRKRVFDIVFASFALVVFSPLMLLIAVLIKLESRGPILFKQRRHGFNNKPIEVLKFRSMYTDQCDPTAVKAVRRGDSRVTKVGRFIRRASIDELPQFFNVLKGELSIVGPRPHAMAARTGDIVYDQVAEAYSARHKVKPGVTGWAQINGWRGEMNSPEKIKKRVEHDLYYIEHWSLWLDIKITFMTPWSLVTTKNAY